MNFCGVRIKTEPAAEKKMKKLKPLEVQKDMWACEKEAIEEHNAKVKLQNKGASLSTLNTIDMSFLASKFDTDKNPIFGVFPATSFNCKLTITLSSNGIFTSLAGGGLPKIISDGYRVGLKGKKLHDRWKQYELRARFVGLLPQKTKEKITALRGAGISTYIVAETRWDMKNAKLPNPDPLIIAIHDSKVYLVDVFDASIAENYVAHEFTTDPDEKE